MSAKFTDYIVKDLSLAEWGRKGNRHRRNRDAGTNGDAC